jgi:hypothetical protein
MMRQGRGRDIEPGLQLSDWYEAGAAVRGPASGSTRRQKTASITVTEWTDAGIMALMLAYPSRRRNLPAFKVIVDALRHRDTR